MTLADRLAPERLLSVVLPVFNERAILGRLSSQIEAACGAAGMRYEIVFVNDGSRDGSGLILDELALHGSQFRVVHLSRNFGHQAALHAGLNEATGDAVVLMDSDLQDAPNAIGDFVASWRAGHDVVYAVRTQRKESRWKRAAFASFYRLLSASADRPLPLDAGNFGLIDRRVADQILSLGERDRYFPGLRHWVGFSQIGVPVERQARYDGRPRISWMGLWRLAKTAVFSFSTLPLTVFYVIGYAALAIFAVLAGYSLFCKLFTDLAIPGWTSHILSASFFGALNALGISILGEYVVRIYDQVRGRPLYIVARRVNAVLAVSEANDTTAETGRDSDYDAVLEQTRAMLAEISPQLDSAEAAPATQTSQDSPARKPRKRAVKRASAGRRAR